MARGAAVPGNPLYWAVARQRLYLFESPVARDAFTKDERDLLAAAEAKWPDLLKTLVP